MSRAKDRAVFESNVDRSGGPDACHPWMGKPNGGYGRAKVNGRTVRAHRAAFLFAHGRWPEPECCHSCDVRYPPSDTTYRLCCNEAHLYEGTHRQNMGHMAATGRAASKTGERNGRAKLTEAEVRALLALKGTMLQREAGALFGVRGSMVGKIWRGRHWSHLQESK